MRLSIATIVVLAYSVGALYIQDSIKDTVQDIQAIPLLQRERLKHAEPIISEYTHSPTGSTIYERWTSPDGSFYVVPRINSTDIEESQRYKFGYKLLEAEKDSDFIKQAKLEEDGVNYLEEENVVSMGFPWLWAKDDCGESQESNFPFGAEKFLLVGIKRDKRDLSSMQAAEINENEEKVDSANLPFWHSDDCDGGESEKLFGTDKFLFVGIGSVREDGTQITDIDNDNTNTGTDSVVESDSISAQSKPKSEDGESLLGWYLNLTDNEDDKFNGASTNSTLGSRFKKGKPKPSSSVDLNDSQIAVGNGSFLIHDRNKEDNLANTDTSINSETTDPTTINPTLTSPTNTQSVKNNTSHINDMFFPTINSTKSVSKDDNFLQHNFSTSKNFKNEAIRNEHWSYFGALVALTIAVVLL